MRLKLTLPHVRLWPIPEDYAWIAMMACVYGAFVLGFLAGKL